jgi:hypothetical protein
MKLAELKARLIGRTIVDVTLSVNEEMGAIEIGRITLDDGTQVSTEANHGPVWIDYLLVGPNEEHITISPDESDIPVEEDEDEGWDEEESEPVVMLSDVLTTDELQAVIDQCWMSGKLIAEQGEVLSTHRDETFPCRAMNAGSVSVWYELEWGLNGRTKEPNKTVIGIADWNGKTHILQGTRFKATDEWSSVSTGVPE